MWKSKEPEYKKMIYKKNRIRVISVPDFNAYFIATVIKPVIFIEG